MNRATNRGSTAYEAKIPRTEWDFSKVPYDQLDACFAWEFGREWKLLRHGSSMDMVPVKKSPDYEKYKADPEQWVGCGRAAALVEFREMLDTPWQELPKDVRVRVMKCGTSDSIVLVEIKADTESEAGEKESPRLKLVTFQMNWDHNDKRLLSEFAAWLRESREKPAKEQRGRNRRDDLNMLGAMRLLHHLRLEDAVVETTRAAGEPLYGKRPSWERARKCALKVFQEDFLIDSRWQESQMPISFSKLEKD